MAATIQFERVDCTRCSGTGVWGGTVNGKPVGACFRCNGKKGPLTPAGRRAQQAYQAWLDEHMTRPAADVTVGMGVRHRGRWCLVTEVRRDGDKVILMSGSWAVDSADTYVVKPQGADFARLAERMKHLKGAIVTA